MVHQAEKVYRDDQQAMAGVTASASTPHATFKHTATGMFRFFQDARRFERFRQASNPSTSSEENQVNTLIYCMGDEAGDVLRGLKLTEAEHRQYSTVRDGFQDFFIVKKNVVSERALFNMRKHARR